MSSTINMAFARRPSLGFSTRLLLFPTISTPTISLIAQRHLSTSRRALQAQPAHNHSHDSSKSPRLGTGIYSAKDEPGKYVNPYEGGPSALEKAAHLFFFTEIARGWFIVATRFVSVVSEHSSSQACGWSWNSSSVPHTQSCTLLRRAHSHLASAESMHFVVIRAEKSVASVRMRALELFLANLFVPTYSVQTM